MDAIGPIAAGWYADPTGRHVWRWWDGSTWTDRVGDGSTEYHDAIGIDVHPVPAGPVGTWSAASQPEQRAGRTWLIVALVVGGIMVFAGIGAVLLFVVSGSTGPIINENFAHGAGKFSTDTDNLVDLQVVDGAYQVTIKETSSPQEMRSFFEPARSAITVAATVAVADAPAAVAAGLSCYSNSDTGYLFLVTTDGQWAVVKTTSFTSGTQKVLDEGTGETPLSTEPIALHLGCKGGGTEPTVITVQVNGGNTHIVTDGEGYDQFRAAGFFAAAEDAPSILLFDDMVVKKSS
jgi:hypothetical protein